MTVHWVSQTVQLTVLMMVIHSVPQMARGIVIMMMAVTMMVHQVS